MPPEDLHASAQHAAYCAQTRSTVYRPHRSVTMHQGCGRQQDEQIVHPLDGNEVRIGFGPRRSASRIHCSIVA